MGLKTRQTYFYSQQFQKEENEDTFVQPDIFSQKLFLFLPTATAVILI